MNFRTRIDFTNRQAKQYEKTNINLSGGTIFGLPYSALTSGPDLTLTGITYEDAVLQSTYSGNTGTTVYTFGDSRMSIDEGDLSALTPSNSGTTQYAGPTWVGYDMFTTVDGYTGWTSYSAITYDLDVITMVDLGGGSYSGVVQSDFIVYSSASVDYTGSTIWVDVSGITRTDELIVTKNSQIGYVLTCFDVDGKAKWLPVSGATSGSTFTGNTSGDCIGDLWITNLHGCSPITIHDSIQSIGSSATGAISFAFGTGTTASGNYSHAEGSGTTASNTTSHAEGRGTTASGLYSHAEGWNTIASGAASYAGGFGTTASGAVSHTEGQFTIASGYAAHAEGESTVASGVDSHAEGSFTTASGNSSHAEGQLTIAGGQFSHSEGRQTKAYGDYSHAGGYISIASGDTSFIHSANSLVTGARSAVLGGQNITGTADDTVYVPDLVIDGLTSTDPIATDANGLIVAGASDVRLKTNIKSLLSPLDKIKAIRGVSFEWTPESNMGSGITKFGFIAQEVQEVIPDMVRERSKGDGMLSLSYTEIVPWLVEAVKELSSGSTIISNNELILEKETIASEDNNIELNYNGNHETSIGGGITVLHAIKDGIHSEIKTDENGRWLITPALATTQLSLPKYTPKSTDDGIGETGDTVWDDDYIYIKKNNGWGRCKLENF